MTRVPNSTLFWLALAITLAVLPHFRHLPIWIPAVSLALIGGRLITTLWLHGIPNLSRWVTFPLRAGLSAGLLLGIYLQFGVLLGRDPGVALLVVLTGFKFMELRGQRDHYVVGALGLFLIVTNFFYSQTLFTAAYMLPVVLLLLAGLLDTNDPRHQISPLGKLQHSGLMLAQALPLMILVFVLFPRLPGPLWGMPENDYSGVTGLDDQMSPGSISQLSESDEVAFRVKFKGPPPPPSQRYWRGPVLWDTDGRRWTAGQGRDLGQVELIGRGEPVDYTLTLEPHNKKWVFALELPAAEPDSSQFNHDYQLLAHKPVGKRIRYELTAYTDYRLTGADQVDFERALSLPPAAHPKAVALARQWRDQGLNSRAIVNKALGMFHNQTFYYSLSPPILTGDSVDEFLFETREGFCEHYAAAFTVLMRAAGIPARIVTGYQGGTLNPVGDYFVIRQHDAHAWTEVWLDHSGWQRIDPTEAVSPARINEGIATALPDSAINVPLGLQPDSWVAGALRRLRDNWDAISNGWNQWVLGYSQRRQQQLLGRIGINYTHWRELALWLAGVCGVMIGIVAIWLLTQRHRPHPDRARRWYDRYCAKLARAGIARQGHEGPRDFARRASARFSRQADRIHEITDLYIRARYSAAAADLAGLRRAIRRFRPS